MNFKNDDEFNCINIIYQISQKISEGSFGYLYKGVNLVNRNDVAIKIEKNIPKAKSSLAREVKFLRELQGDSGIPEIYWYGTDKNLDVKALVFQYLGSSLEDRIRKQKKLSLKTVVFLAEKIIDIIEKVHIRGILHRDIKPANILLGRGKNYKDVYVVDYGISKRFIDKSGEHIPLKNSKPFIGTMRFASEASHLGFELSRKDDLESLGYSLLYLFKGELPWMHKGFRLEEKKRKVGELKCKITSNDLCSECPSVFPLYFKYIKNLGFYETPNYDYLKNLFSALGKALNVSIDNKLWDLKSYSKSSNNSFSLEIPKVNSKMKINSQTEQSKKIYNKDEYEPGITERPGIFHKMAKLNTYSKNSKSKSIDIDCDRRERISKTFIPGEVNRTNSQESKSVFSLSKSYYTESGMPFESANIIKEKNKDKCMHKFILFEFYFKIGSWEENQSEMEEYIGNRNMGDIVKSIRKQDKKYKFSF